MSLRSFFNPTPPQMDRELKELKKEKLELSEALLEVMEALKKVMEDTFGLRDIILERVSDRFVPVAGGTKY